jgi:hypothetical protein
MHIHEHAYTRSPPNPGAVWLILAAPHALDHFLFLDLEFYGKGVSWGSVVDVLAATNVTLRALLLILFITPVGTPLFRLLH